MSAKFDPYHKWLGIPAEEQPPNHYRLLAIPLFEEDADVISYAADRQMAHLRTFQSGAHSAESQQLLNEASAARKCLLNPQEKNAYDAQLKKTLQQTQATAAPATATPSDSPSKIARTRATGTRAGGSGISSASKSGVKKLTTRPRTTAPAASSEFDIVTDGSVAGPSASSVKHGSSKGVAHHPASVADRHRTGSRKTNIPIGVYAGGGVLALGLIGALVFVLSKGEAPQPGELDHNLAQTSEESSHPPISTLPEFNSKLIVENEKSPPKVLPPSATMLAKPISLLERINPSQNQLEGNWIRSGKDLVAPSGNFVRLEVPFVLPKSYLLTIVASWPATEANLCIGLPVEERQVMLKIDDRSGPKSSGLDLIGGRPSRNNVTHREGTFLRASQSNTIHCAVRPGEICAYCNGQEVVRWTGNSEQLSLPIKWSTRDRRHAFLGSWNSSFQIHQLEVGPLTPGFKPEPIAELPKLAEKSADVPDSEEEIAAILARGEEVDLLKLIDITRAVGDGIWRKEGEALISPTIQHAKLQVPVKPPSQYELAIVVQRLAGIESLKIGIIVGGNPVNVVLDGYRSTSSGLDMIDGKRMKDNETFYSKPVIVGMELHEIVCSVTENHVRVTCNGEQIVDWQGDPELFSLESGARWPDTTQLCLGSFQSSFSISSFKMRQISSNVKIASRGPATNPPGNENSSATKVSDGNRLPVPDTSAMAAALEQLKTELSDLYAEVHRPENKLPLAEQLMQRATAGQDDPTVQYVLLTEASSHASDVAEAKLALDACRKLAEKFEVDGLTLQAAALAASVRGLKTNSQRYDLTMECLAAMSEAVAQDHYEAAAEFSNTAYTASARSDDLELKKLTRAHRDHIKSLQSAWEKVSSSAKSLETDPADSAANLEVGQFRCFWQANWQRGLPLLAQGSDPVLRSLAAADLKDPEKSSEQLRLGDDWWDYGEKQPMPARLVVLDRAALWYDLGLTEEVSGIQRTRIEARLAKFNSLRDAAGPLFARAAHPSDAVMFGKHWYKFFTDRLSWEDAKAECEKLGGYLVCIETPEENLFVKTLAIGDDGNSRRRIPYWLGASDAEREGLFRWVNGSQSFYADWKPGEPNNTNREEHYVGIMLTGFGNFEITPDRMKWNDYKALQQFPYVCEWDR